MQFDTIVPIDLTPGKVEENVMALRTARTLATGLGFLYRCVRGVEERILAQLEQSRGPELHCLLYGNASELADAPIDLFESAFRWYAVSLCDFVRVAAFLGDMNTDARKAYAAKVLGGVQSFRDKVGAHTAGFTKNDKDNDAERSFTPCEQVAWESDRFAVGTFTLRVRRGEKSSDSSALTPWRLTEVHEGLCDRYPLLADLTREPAFWSEVRVQKSEVGENRDVASSDL